MHARLECCDSRFAANLQCILYALDWIEVNAVASSVQIAERKEFHSKWNQCGSISESRQCKKDDTWWSDFLFF